MSEPEAGYDKLNERLKSIKSYSEHGSSPEHFLEMLARAHPTHARFLCERLLTDGGAPLASYAHTLLRGLWEKHGATGRVVARRLVDSSDVQLNEQVARCFSSATARNKQGWQDSRALQPEDVELLLDVSMGSSSRSAEHLCYALMDVIAHDALPLPRLVAFLGKLVPIQHLSEGGIWDFLTAVAAHHPPEVLSLRLARIASLEDAASQEKEPFPRKGKPGYLERLGTGVDAATHLQSIFENLTRAPASNRKWLAILFNSLSEGCSSDASLELLKKQALEANTEAMAAVTSILSHAPSDFVISQFELTTHLIARARTLGEQSYVSLTNRLLSRAMGAPGEGDWIGSAPRDEELPDNIRDCLNMLAPGSVAFRFYETLLEQLS